jgi:hypothetical protein
LPTTNKESGVPEKAFDEQINDLIMQRKLQQEALFKIKSFVEKRQSEASAPAKSSSNKKPK